jgi:hypothetical protein
LGSCGNCCCRLCSQTKSQWNRATMRFHESCQL